MRLLTTMCSRISLGMLVTANWPDKSTPPSWRLVQRVHRSWLISDGTLKWRWDDNRLWGADCNYLRTLEYSCVCRGFQEREKNTKKKTYDRWTLLRSLKPKVYWNIAGLVRLRKETVETRLFNWTYLNTLHFVLQYFGLKAVVIWSREII